MGFGLNEIKEILQEHDYGGCLKRRYEQMLEEQEKMKKQILMVESAMRQAERKDNMQFDVSIKDFKAKKVASLRRVIAKYEDEGTLWKDLFPVLEAQKAQLAQPPYCAAVFFDEGFKEADVDVEIQAAVTGDFSDMDGVVFKTIAPVKCATVILKGDYSQITTACEQVGKWIEDNAYAMCGPMFNIYHVSPGCEANPENWVTEICFPVKKH